MKQVGRFALVAILGSLMASALLAGCGGSSDDSGTAAGSGGAGGTGNASGNGAGGNTASSTGNKTS